MTDLVLRVGRTVAFLAGLLFVAERFFRLSIAAQRLYGLLIY